jgi:hypothetical protein
MSLSAEGFNAEQLRIAKALGLSRMPKPVCGRPMVTYVWGNRQNPDYWNCAREPGHKGPHRRYSK